MIEVFTLLGLFVFLHRRTLRFLHILQQDDYSVSRMLHWVRDKKAFDRRGTLALLLGGILAFLFDSSVFWLISGVSFIFWGLVEPDPRREAKLSLKMTPRAQRLFWTTGLLEGVGALGIFLLTSTPLSFLLVVQGVPLFLALAVWVQSFKEHSLQRRFLSEAREKFQQVSPYTIGITGSYGKTSVKNALGEVLQIALGPTFWPHKGVNTPMGITRWIRESLKQGHDYAVMEMAAYGEGSIRRLCELTPPHAAIVTAVGLTHLERFGSQEAIYRGKSELPQAVPEEGIVVYNGDDPLVRKMSQEFPKQTTLLYGFHGDDLDCKGRDVVTEERGTSFVVDWEGRSYSGFTPLHGVSALSNLLGVFCMACALGADPEFVLAIFRNLKPVDNRLQVVRVGSSTHIRDAYNSNPQGFRSALNLLSQMKGKRRILMTPGIIELGERQEKENEAVAREAAGVCDLALVVGPVNRTPWTTGLKKGGLSESQILYFPHRDEAFSCYQELQKEGDVLLIENDLTDLYEQGSGGRF